MTTQRDPLAAQRVIAEKLQEIDRLTAQLKLRDEANILLVAQLSECWALLGEIARERNILVHGGQTSVMAEALLRKQGAPGWAAPPTP